MKKLLLISLFVCSCFNINKKAITLSKTIDSLDKLGSAYGTSPFRKIVVDTLIKATDTTFHFYWADSNNKITFIAARWPIAPKVIKEYDAYFKNDSIFKLEIGTFDENEDQTKESITRYFLKDTIISYGHIYNSNEVTEARNLLQDTLLKIYYNK